jgi:hypothetical protein
MTPTNMTISNEIDSLRPVHTVLLGEFYVKRLENFETETYDVNGQTCCFYEAYRIVKDYYHGKAERDTLLGGYGLRKSSGFYDC